MHHLYASHLISKSRCITIAVSFEAINQDIPIYEPIRTEIELAVENGEIEVEMSSPKL